MHLFKKFLLFLILTAGFSSAQTMSRDPAGMGPTIKFGNGTFENGLDRWGFWQMTPDLAQFEISDQKPHSGSKCAKLSIKNIAGENWYVQLQMHNFSIEKNIMYKLTYWARGENNASTLEVAFVKGSPPWTFYGAKKAHITSGWKQYEVDFVSPGTTTDIQMVFQCGKNKGDYYIDDVEFVPSGKFDLKEVPADWYEKADQRIDQTRKGDFELSIADRDGKPFSGTVELHLKRHQFQWGTCLSFQGGSYEDLYRKTAAKIFNGGVFENAFKWEEYEKNEGQPSTGVIDEYLKWSKKNNFPLRGHALVWGTENYGYDKHWARQKDDNTFRLAIKNRITRDLTRYKGQIHEYDIWNEPVHEQALFNRLGWDILDSSFFWAHRTDPDAKLFINEYSNIDGADTKLYRDLIDNLLKRKVPVEGIGVQGHFAGPIDPRDIASKLDYLAETGLPIKVTEFDMDVRAMGLSDSTMACEYSKMMRTAFSHPAIEGFLMWGFWDGRHWRPGAGLYNAEFKAKPAADSVYNLIHNVWTTNETLKTDSLGKVKFRGFYGDYDIVIKDSKNRVKKNVASFLKGKVGIQKIRF